MLAPKITHQIWLQGWDKLPEKFQKNVSRLHELNPEFQHMQWTDASLRDECAALGPDYLSTYDSFTVFISKVDFGRYVVLYRHGGISIDTDMESLRPLRDTPELDQSDFIVSSSPIFPKWCNLANNALIICTPDHSIMKHMLDTIVSEQLSVTKYPINGLYVTNTTGPLFINRVLRQFGDKIHMLDNKYFEPCLSGDMFCTDFDKTIMNHRHELSWLNPVTKFIIRNIVFIVIALFFVIRFKHTIYKIGNDIYHIRSNRKSTDMGR